MKTTSKRRQPLNEDNLKYEDDIKNDDDLKYETTSNMKAKSIMKTTSNLSYRLLQNIKNAFKNINDIPLNSLDFFKSL